MRIAWRSVDWTCERVAAEAQAQRDLLSGLERIGFNEVAIRKGQRYVTVVVDHDTGKLVWAHPGRDRKATEKFLDLLGQERLKRIKLVSCGLDHPAGARALRKRDRLSGPVSHRQGRH
jgi:transposase